MVNSAAEWRGAVALTYPGEFPKDGRRVKADLNHFGVELRRKYEGIEYRWVLEFQKRGAPHFHLVTDREVDRWWCAITWARVVGSADSKHVLAGTRTERITDRRRFTRYLIGYLGKGQQKTVPAEYRDVGRLWGGSRETLEPLLTAEVPVDVAYVVRRALRGYVERTGRRMGFLRRPHVGCTVFDAASVLGRLIVDLGLGGARGP